MEGITFNLRWGIRERLVLTIALLALVVAVVFAVLSPMRVEQQALRALDAKGVSIAEITAFSVGPALQRQDAAAVREALRGARHNPDLAYIVVTDASGRGVAAVMHADEEGAVAPEHTTADTIPGTAQRWVRISVPILQHGVRLGAVHLGLSLDDVRAEVDAQRRFSLLLALVMFIGGVALAYGIGTLVTRPLAELADTATRIAGGELGARGAVRSDDEVARVVRAFNMMMDSLQAARDALAEANATLESRVAERTAQLREAIGELGVLKDEAEAATRLKSDFLATMSHEIRTPMNGILGTITLLQATSLDAKQRHLADLAKSSADSLLVLINDILDYSKIEAGRMQLSPEPFDVRALCEGVCDLLRPHAAEKALSLLLDCGKDVPRVLVGDAGRIRQVLLNLTSNGIKFTSNGSVTLAVSVADQADGEIQLRMEVRDTGVGIDEETQRRLFQKFVQGDASTTRRHGGTGLGLAISRNLVELMHGKLEVRSASGSGSVFFFELHLPVASDEAVSALAPRSEVSAEASRSPEPVFTEGEHHVLIADDNPVNLAVASAMLNALGCVADLARDGAEAVAKARRRHYEAIFMDVQMPVIDGLAATASIRRSKGPNTSTPIIALTADISPSDRQRALAAGMTDHVPKPINPGTLRAALIRWCAVAELTP